MEKSGSGQEGVQEAWPKPSYPDLEKEAKNEMKLGAEVLEQIQQSLYFTNSIRKAFMAYGNYLAIWEVLKSRVEKAYGVCHRTASRN